MNPEVDHIVYLFDGFRLDAGRRQLSSSGGVVIPLHSRAMEVLVLLLSQAGELVSKRLLLENVWPAAVVEDNNINQCILAIRKALGESAGSNRFIMTVPGRGYRFVAAVTVQQREPTDGSAPAPRFSGESRRWWTLALPGFAAASALVLLALHASRSQMSPRQPAESRELVVHLRGDMAAAPAPGTRTLLACLRDRPDLHLRVQVDVVASDSAPPVWTGHYIAGVQDLLANEPIQEVDAEACHRLGAR